MIAELVLAGYLAKQEHPQAPNAAPQREPFAQNSFSNGLESKIPQYLAHEKGSNEKRHSRYQSILEEILRNLGDCEGINFFDSKLGMSYEFMIKGEYLIGGFVYDVNAEEERTRLEALVYFGEDKSVVVHYKDNFKPDGAFWRRSQNIDGIYEEADGSEYQLELEGAYRHYKEIERRKQERRKFLF